MATNPSNESIQGPTFLRFVEPVLEALRARDGSAAASEVTDAVIARANVSPEEYVATTSNGKNRLRNQVAWARFYLFKGGYLNSPKHGVWALTGVGRNPTRGETDHGLFHRVQAMLTLPQPPDDAEAPSTQEGPELTDAEIRSRFQRFRSSNWNPDWSPAYLTDLHWVADATDDELRTKAAQERLWSLSGIASVGLGNSVNVGDVTSDPTFVERVISLRREPLPSDPAERARLLQAAYEELLAIVHPRFASRRPKARLARIFSALFPRETHTTYDKNAPSLVARLVGPLPAPLIHGMVLTRQRLREVLGPETDIAEDVQRAKFCWSLVVGDEASDPVGDHTAHQEQLTLPPLTLLPFARQKRGLVAVKRYVDAWRAVVNACWHGAAIDEMVDVLRDQYEMRQLHPKSCKQLIGTVRSYRFVTEENGTWRPTDDGRRLVDDDRPDILVERFLVESYGLAQLLRDLRSGPLGRAVQTSLIRARYPAWTGDFGPSSLFAWSAALGLTQDLPEKRRGLTDYGREWEARLPDVLPSPPRDGAPDPIDSGTEEPPTFDEIFTDLVRELPGFVLDEAQLRSIHVALHCHEHKHFVILSGLSGTGKTELLRQYARSYTRLTSREPTDHVLVAAVSPDWRDPTGLIGYMNPIRGDATWHYTPALELILAAHENPKSSYFLVLDEMNLAHVEHYFAPILSAMESIGGASILHFHSEDGDIDGVPPSIPWPSNLYICGTINMDETTHTVSDKVLDRAFTLEFWDVDLEKFLEKKKAPASVTDVLIALHDELAAVRRHFGYRTASEILAFIGHPEAGGALLDQAVFSKVLPRLRGADSERLRAALAKCETICGDAKLVRSAQKLHDMRLRLIEVGVTRFWS
ncbi:MAG: ATP-binding protein [Myxococcales bacterium]|nr:ATP-binding protein [Myxococcales bacterium]